MRALFIHQNFPGQFREIQHQVVGWGWETKAICSCQREWNPTIEVRIYKQPEQAQNNKPEGILGEVNNWIARGTEVAKEALKLKTEGWAPDIILAHPGWGECLYIKSVFPSSVLACWPELWLNYRHMGANNSRQLKAEDIAYIETKNWLAEKALGESNLIIAPTIYQQSSFPERHQQKITVIHEGVREDLFEMPRLKNICLPSGIELKDGTPVITFTSRNLEPMRGFDLLMQTIPSVQAEIPTAHFIIVGGDEQSYSGKHQSGKTWLEVYKEEWENQIDWKRVHILGRLPYGELLKIYRRSDLHLYLSKEFVLSWSLIEAAALGCKIVCTENLMSVELADKNESISLSQDNTKELTKTIRYSLETSCDERDKWRKQIKKEYCISNTSSRLHKALEESLNIF